MPEASAREAGTAQGAGDLPAIDERPAERLSTLDRGFPEQTRTNCLTKRSPCVMRCTYCRDCGCYGRCDWPAVGDRVSFSASGSGA